MDNFGPRFMIINYLPFHGHGSPAPPSDWWRFLPPGMPAAVVLLNQENIHGGDVDSSSSAVPRNSGYQFPVYSPEPLQWMYQGSGGRGYPSPAVDCGEGSSHDTTLSLVLPSSPRNPNPAADSSVVGFPIEGGDGVVDSPVEGGDEVDTELRLGSFLLNSLPNGKKEEPTKAEETEEREKSHGGVRTEENKAMYLLNGKKEEPAKPVTEEREESHGGGSGTREKKVTEKKKRKVRDGGAEEKKIEQPKRMRRNERNDEDQRPLIPIERIPVLHETLERRGGTGPVFLYRKKLTISDVNPDQNRLLVTSKEKLKEFLSEEEMAAVNRGNGGVKAVAIDCGGRVYEVIGLTKWGKVTVFKTAWRPMFQSNGAEKDQVVEVWGYREDGKPCFAFNFREDDDHQPQPQPQP